MKEVKQQLRDAKSWHESEILKIDLALDALNGIKRAPVKKTIPIRKLVLMCMPLRKHIKLDDLMMSVRERGIDYDLLLDRTQVCGAITHLRAQGMIAHGNVPGLYKRIK